MQKPPARFAHLLGPSASEELTGQPLTIEEEMFALRVVELRNGAAAYRAVYDCSKVAPYNVYNQARTLMGRADVAARISEHRAVIEAQCVAKVLDHLRDLDDIATADPNELVSIRIYGCRHCHGEGFAYQWRDEAEMTKAYAEYGAALEAHHIDPTRPAPADPPDNSGGYGFRRTAPVNLECPQCEGQGVTDVVLADTTCLSPKAAKLYKGAKVTKEGRIEVMMHDQTEARTLILRVLGALGAGVGDKGGREVSDVDAVLKRIADSLPS